jgi:sterol desaturase/sphingolipid hydroxylase (fatty acid hydroxylase superfamily)
MLRAMRDWVESASLERLLLACTVLCLVLTALGLIFGFALERSAQASGRKVFDVPLKRGQFRTEAIGTAWFHVVFIPPLALALWARWITFTDGWLPNLVAVPALWVAFQLQYYPLHRLAHRRALFWIHRWHHESLVTTPLTGLSMHPAEAAVWVVMMLGPAIVLARLGLLGIWGALTFLFLHWVGGIAGHANADIIPFKASRLSSLWRVPDSYHCLHHARFDGHFGFAAAYMDRLFGTEFDDWEAVQARVWRNEPLESIREHAT